MNERKQEFIQMLCDFLVELDFTPVTLYSIKDDENIPVYIEENGVCIDYGYQGDEAKRIESVLKEECHYFNVDYTNSHAKNLGIIALNLSKKWSRF